MEAVVIIALIACLAIAIRSAFFKKAEKDSLSLARPESQSTSAPATTPPKGTDVDLTAFLPEQFVVLDLETTGLSASRDEIIEIGAIRVTLGSDQQLAFSTLVKPSKRIPRKITEITGITQGMVDADGLESADAFSRFIEFIGDMPLVTYNAEFDMAFLWETAKRHGATMNNLYTCALKRARRAWPGLSSYKLVNMAKMGHLSDEDPHRALGDCKRALIVFTASTSTLGQKVRWSKPPSQFGEQLQ